MNIGESLKKLNEVNLSDLDFENVGAWPLPMRIISCLLVLLLVIFLGYQFHLSGLQTRLDREIAREKELKEQFRTKAFQSANLGAYREQMRQIEDSFGALVRQLPSDTEVPVYWKTLPLLVGGLDCSLRQLNCSRR